MSYSLKQALLLSSQNSAMLNVGQDYTIQYRLIANHYESDKPDDNYCALCICRVEKYSKGTPIFAAEPHRIIQKDSIAQLIDYLTEYGFSVDDAWSPVEAEKGAET